jgi:hypothetical protein
VTSNNSVDLLLNTEPLKATVNFIVKRPSTGLVAHKSVQVARMTITKLTKNT